MIKDLQKKPENLKITAIVPVYNNEKTVERVLSVLEKCDFFEKIIVVDDHSKDSSFEVLRKFDNKKTAIVSLLYNHGKGAAIKKAFSLVKTPIVMIVDADLSKLRKEHIVNLRNAFFGSDVDMVIAARRGDPDIYIRTTDYLSGERIFYMQNINDEWINDLLGKVGNGFEQVINAAHKDRKVKMIYSYKTGHIIKLTRYRGKDIITKMPISYLREAYQLIKTEAYIRKILWGKELNDVTRSLIKRIERYI